jgi:hypothetical protein
MCLELINTTNWLRPTVDPDGAEIIQLVRTYTPDGKDLSWGGTIIYAPRIATDKDGEAEIQALRSGNDINSPIADFPVKLVKECHLLEDNGQSEDACLSPEIPGLFVSEKGQWKGGVTHQARLVAVVKSCSDKTQNIVWSSAGTVVTENQTFKAAIAAENVVHQFMEHFRMRGDSAFLKFPVWRGWGQGQQIFELRQYKEIKILLRTRDASNLDPSDLTEADRLNGIDWAGSIAIYCSVVRRYDGRSWSDWENRDSTFGLLGGLWSNDVEEKNRVWTSNEQHALSAERSLRLEDNPLPSIEEIDSALSVGKP